MIRSHAPSLDELARPQSGVVSRRQLIQAGWSASRVDRAAGREMLRPLARGVYRTAGAPWSRSAARQTALLLCGDGGVLARWSAAELHGFAEPRSGPIQLAIPHGRRIPRTSDRLLTAYRTRHLGPDEIEHIEGLPVTNGPRTVLDLAAVLSIPRLAETTAACLRGAACGSPELRAVLAAHPNARGRQRLRTVLELLGDDAARSRSDVEVAALAALTEAGLPRPVLAHRVRARDGRFVAEVDLAYPDVRIAIEIDGFAWHSSPERKQADEVRQNRLMLNGWTVLRFSARDVRHRKDHLVTTVRAALGAAGFEG